MSKIIQLTSKMDAILIIGYPRLNKANDNLYLAPQQAHSRSGQTSSPDSEDPGSDSTDVISTGPVCYCEDSGSEYILAATVRRKAPSRRQVYRHVGLIDKRQSRQLQEAMR
ncbi:hypothetical protein ACO0LO_20005 [Undibacterium sp. TJN25]|uniref:hypothetical protein n=1 Tax=Undibacterium sp. TJN25 TaxID=3413056 RepID=UPI003BF2AD90